MKALLELASLFQVIPKPSRLLGKEAERGRGGGRKSALRPSPTVGECFATSTAAADGYGNAHTLNTKRQVNSIFPPLQARPKQGMWDPTWDTLLHSV